MQKVNFDFHAPCQLLVSPQMLDEQFPISSKIKKNILDARRTIHKIVQGEDKRLLVIVGPCSIHDPKAALEYAHLLYETAQAFIDDLVIVMRTYFEKPRTSIGWKGFISDPYLDGSFNINAGLKIARKLLLDIADLQLPTATEFLDPLIASYLSELISWGAIGARTSESQIHRELVSGLPMPVGFKNTTDGNIQTAIDAVKVAQVSQRILGIAKDGLASIIPTSGNKSCHIVLRGSQHETNFEEKKIKATLAKLQEHHLKASLMVDCSHGNSGKDYFRQIHVANEIAKQIYTGSNAILGVMLESHLIAGNQQFSPGKSLVYGQSITDGCLAWKETFSVLERLALVQRKRIHCY